MSRILTTKKDRGKYGLLEVPKCPGPWQLKIANSWVFPFFYGRSKIEKLLGSNNENVCENGLGVVMIVQYSDSPVGAYDEILICLPQKRTLVDNEWVTTRSIPIIYVSTEASLRNGRENWGIRKELAKFSWEKNRGYFLTTTTVTVSTSITNEYLFDATFTTLNFSVPLSLGILGKLIPCILEEKIDEEGVVSARDFQVIRPSGSGWTKLSFLQRCMSSSTLPLQALGLFVGAHLTGRLVFPAAKTIHV